MALNRVDARQRAFQAIDTSNPAGTWIDESGYNRCSSGVLCGNWQEDGILKESKAALGPGLHETLNPKADWGNPKEGRKFNKVPNFQSTEFLINARLDSDDWKSEKMQSYQGQQVNTRPDGTRSKAVSREILKATDQVCTGQSPVVALLYWMHLYSVLLVICILCLLLTHVVLSRVSGAPIFSLCVCGPFFIALWALHVGVFVLRAFWGHILYFVRACMLACVSVPVSVFVYGFLVCGCVCFVCVFHVRVCISVCPVRDGSEKGQPGGCCLIPVFRGRSCIAGLSPELQ